MQSTVIRKFGKWSIGKDISCNLGKRKPRRCPTVRMRSAAGKFAGSFPANYYRISCNDFTRARARRKQVGSGWCTRTRRAALQSVPASDQQAPANENRCDYPTDLTDSRSRLKGAARCAPATASAAPLYSRRTIAMGEAEKHAASVRRARMPT